MPKQPKQDLFTRFTSTTSEILGRPWIFVGALVLLFIWVTTGPLLNFSNTWQLIINTSTTIITFLMVFIIQNTQNRDNLATQIKLDTIMDKLRIDDKELIDAEDESDTQLESDRKHVQKKTERHKHNKRK